MPAALHRVRYQWTPSASIDIEWSKGRGELRPDWQPVAAVSLCEEELAPDDFARRGIPAICWRGDTPVLFERLQLRENTDYLIDITLPLTRQAAENLSLGNKAWPFSERLGAVFKADPPRRWRQEDANSIVITGQLRLRNHAGILDLAVDGVGVLKAEVVCRKIGYLTEFQTLLNEVAGFVAELLLQYDSPVSIVFDLTDARDSSRAAMLFQMRHVMSEGNLPLAVEEIFSQIHAALVTTNSIRGLTEIEDVSPEMLADEMNISEFGRGGPLAGLFRGFTPRELPVVETIETIDTPENRYAKYFLEECASLAQWLSSRLATQSKMAAAREAESWHSYLQDVLGNAVWRSVRHMRQFPSNSQVLMKRRGYRELLRLDMALRLSLTLPWSQGEKFAEGLLGDIRPVSELYEYWCFFSLRRLLAELCQQEVSDSSSFIASTAGGLQIRLLKGKRSRVGFQYRSELSPEIIKVDLFYNRRFRRPSRNIPFWEGSYTAAFDPDFSIAISVPHEGKKQKHWLHFDAKYRLETSDLLEALNTEDGEVLADADDDEASYEQEISRFHRREDLFKMHTYRDGILSSRGAYILFPGDGTGLRMEGKAQNLFVRHPSAFKGDPAYKFPSVGAFDLCPGNDVTQLPVLKQFLENVLKSLATNKDYKEEQGFFS